MPHKTAAISPLHITCLGRAIFTVHNSAGQSRHSPGGHVVIIQDQFALPRLGKDLKKPTLFELLCFMLKLYRYACFLKGPRKCGNRGPVHSAQVDVVRQHIMTLGFLIASLEFSALQWEYPVTFNISV
jgi:hypothetical protein